MAIVDGDLLVAQRRDRNFSEAYGAHEHNATVDIVCRRWAASQCWSARPPTGAFLKPTSAITPALELWDEIAPQAEALSMRTTLGYQSVHRSAIALL
jgi:hypothetical protein